MAEKIQRRFRIDEETYNYLNEFAIEHEMYRESPSLALEQVIREHKSFSSRNMNASYIAEVVSQEVKSAVQLALKENVSNEIKKVRLGTNNIDRNTQILIELVQGHMQMENLEHIMTTDLNRPPFLSEVENLVQSRITALKQRKDNHLQKGEIVHGGI